MKKILSMIIVLTIILASAFAVDVSVNLGGGYVINTGKFYLSKSQESSDENKYPKEYKANLVDVDLGVEVEFENNVVVYDTISAGFFGNEIKLKNVGDASFSTIKTKSSLMISEALGVGYKFHMDEFDFLAGAGLRADILNFETKPEKLEIKMRNFGVQLNLKGSYNFDDRFAAMVAFRPAISFYDSWSETKNEVKTKSNGAATGYSLTAVIGAEYKF